MENNMTIHTGHDEKIVVYLATRNLYRLLPAAYNSLLAYNKPDHVYLLIEDDRLPYDVPDVITCVNVSEQTFFSHGGPNYSGRYTYMALMKAAVSKIFPDAEKVLVLDVDTIVNGDLSPLWEIDLNCSYYAAATEPRMSKIVGYTYSNVGVVMLNLDYLRETHMEDDIIHELNTHYHPFPEQDVFNSLCTWHFTEIPADYNVTPTGLTGRPEREIVTHYAGLREWDNFDPVQYWLTHTTPPVKQKYVVYMGNRPYYPMMITAAKSLLYHTKVDRVYFLTEDDPFPVPLPYMFRVINVSRQNIFRPDGPNINPFYTYMTLMRAALTKLIPDAGCVLLLDPDTIVSDDISPLWNYNLSCNYFAAVPETRNNDHTKVPYYNAGVMLMNLKKFREDGMDDRVIHEINTVRYQHMEQDVLNFLCDPYILPLPSCYSASYVSDPCDHPRISHYLAHAKGDLPAAQQPYINLNWNDIPNANGGDKS